MMYNIFPPHDMPWLISSQRSIDDSRLACNDITSRWLKQVPFPGNESSKEEKTDWHRRLCDLHHIEYQKRLDKLILEEPPQAYDVVRQVLRKSAPSRLVLRINVKRSDLVNIIVEDVDDSARFAQNCSQYCQKSNQESPTWSSYKKWLLDMHKGDDEIVTLGDITCMPNDVVVEKCTEFAYNIGIERFVGGLDEDCDQIKRNQWGHYGLFEKMKENIYYPLQNSTSEGNMFGFSVLLKTRLLRSKRDEELFKFQSSLRCLKRKYLKTCHPKSFVVVPLQDMECETEDNAQESFDVLKNYNVLWLPHDFVNLDLRISSHLSWGEGENANIRERLSREYHTDGANLKYEMIARELNVIKYDMNCTSEKMTWRKRFCATLALTRSISRDTTWMTENEHPEKVAKLLKDLATYWRIYLLKKNDELLGIGIDEEFSIKQQEISPSRMALHNYLDQFELDFKESECSQEIEFNWKPRLFALPLPCNGYKRRRITNE